MIRYRYKHWLFKLPLLRRYRAICLGRTVYFKQDRETITPTLLRHEMIHQEQIDRVGLARFYGTYLLDYARNLWRYRNHDEAYRKIRFEAEAFAREETNQEVK